MQKRIAPTIKDTTRYTLFPLPPMGVSPELARYIAILRERQRTKDNGLKDCISWAQTHLRVARKWFTDEPNSDGESTRYWAAQSVKYSMKALLWEADGRRPKDAEREGYSKTLRQYLSIASAEEEAALAPPCHSREQARRALDVAATFLSHAKNAWQGEAK